MSLGVEFAQPWALLALPLAVLPLLRRRRDTLTFSHLAWLPRDRLGQLAAFLWRAFAVAAIASMAIALAGPARPETQVTRTGYGAEIVVLIDRSRSMDHRMLPGDWRTIDPLNLRHHVWSRGPIKSQVARDLLAEFVHQRPTDRFAVMFFSTNPLNVVSFTQHDEVVLAAIEAGGVGRGLGDTDVGRAMLAAIGEFEERPYSGSRIVLLVSDGGAHLDDATRRRIRAGMLRHRIALYWIYLRSYNSPSLDAQDRGSDTVAETALHRFFQGLATPYQAYQAEIPEDLAKAVADVGKQQNLPLDFVERIPREDYSRHFVAAAALACLMLLAYRSLLLRRWV